MGFNQILKRTTFIKDASQSKWIVAYLSQDRSEDYKINLGYESIPNNITIPKMRSGV